MKKVLASLFMLSFITYSVDNLESRIFNQRISTRLGVSKLIMQIENKNAPISNMISGDLFSADEIIKKFNETNTKISDNLLLILPDVNVFNTNLTKFAKTSSNIIVYLADDDYGMSYFKDRTFKKLKELNIDLNKYGIKVINLDLTKAELEEALVQTFDEENIVNTVLYNKVKNLR